MDNANVTDTSQQANPNDTNSAFEPAQPESSNNQVSIDDIILGGVEDTAPFGTPEETNPVAEQVPTQAPIDSIAQTPDNKNDERRFEFWQSRASKLENEVDTLRTQQQQAMAQPQQAAEPEAPVQEEFPPAPERPKKPRSFNREEAYADPNSESARYLDDIDEWRDSSDEYNRLRHQYDLAVMQEKIDKEAGVRKKAEQQREAKIQQTRQVQEITTHVQSQYNMGTEEAQQFVQQMSSPDSLTMDNLVQLWRFQRGQGAPTNAPAPTAPSPAFEQTQRAQQVPSPMGVLPGSSQTAQGSTEDQIMDNMITDLNNKNPWSK
jgi:hypothetical protein